MKIRHWIIAGIALLLVSCNTHSAKQAKIKPSPQAFAQPIVPTQPIVPPVGNLPVIKIPGMIQTSEGKMPLMPVAIASDRDPFAATLIPTDLKAAVQPAAPKAIAVKSTTPPQPIVQPIVQPLPQPIVRFIPTQPTPLSSLPMSSLPMSSLPMMPPPMPPSLLGAPTRLADAIALTGVIQTGSQLSAIVRDSDGSSRYVQVGATLANGEVTVKKINLTSAGDPSIVLQQGGVELVKTVGKIESSIAQTH
ncbi:MAG TPA: hypothetical protein VL134_06955 [Leptolyngbya sp.]|jgi:hypothetical protein|nr:hypothetical protein [Leptolyngbya sp.]